MGDWVLGLSRKLAAYLEIIERTSVDKMVKNPSGDEIIFNCLEENYLMHTYFHSNTGFRILMSATFSDPVEYIKSLGLKGAKYIKLESDFNFDKSPIVFYNKRKMSYNHIQANLPWLLSTTNAIIENHKGQSGLIHSASYDLALKIYNGLSAKNKKRCLIYNGSEEKREFLEFFKRSKDKIIIGPSLLEGLDLNGDLARFQIFAKVPYLSLGDRFVKEKMTANPGWYRWKAVVNIIQGTGRIVRSQKDWGVTYMLDGSLGDLIHMNRKAFPQEFMKRIVLA